MTDPWQNIPEDDGVTLGPEEALAREVAKSKALKVERLQLRDRVDQLTRNNQALEAENQSLRNQLSTFSDSPAGSKDNPPARRSRNLPGNWAVILLIFNLTAIGILLIFLMQKSAS